jgi:hypothetical protein
MAAKAVLDAARDALEGKMDISTVCVSFMPKYYVRKGPFRCNCLTCGKEFLSRVTHGKLCEECKPIWKAKNNGPSYPKALDTASTGAISELFVASELLKEGFQVYRNVAATGCPDLIGIRPDGRMVRIEVKTGTMSTRMDGSKGPVYFSMRKGEKERFDVIAVVSKDGISFFDSQVNPVDVITP